MNYFTSATTQPTIHLKSNGDGSGNGNDTADASEIFFLYKSLFCLVFFHLQIDIIKFAISVRHIFIEAREKTNRKLFIG